MIPSQPARICFPTPARAPGGRLLIRVNPADIAYVAMTVEAYDGLGIPRTIDQRAGIMEILTSPSYAADARALLAALKEELGALDIIGG
ncbi:MAG: DUF4911 domain-containing protein [Nitrospinae bacterium]|nr:DUF4911 domain-containing protein [Nitrospinota bacterium]